LLYYWFDIIEMALQAPNRTSKVPLGAKYGHFEGFLHRDPPEWSLNDGKILRYDKKTDAGYELPPFLIASTPKEKRPPTDTVMVPFEGLF